LRYRIAINGVSVDWQTTSVRISRSGTLESMLHR
jgi:hypothetical protein